MKKQLVSILFALCMVLCLVPLAVFAEGETENVQEVRTKDELVAAMANGTVTTVKLAADIDIDATLKVDRTVTLDLNGYVLKYQNTGTRGSVIKVDINGNLTLKDSNAEKVHKFLIRRIYCGHWRRMMLRARTLWMFPAVSLPAAQAAKSLTHQSPNISAAACM